MELVYYTASRESGDFIEGFETYEEAVRAIEGYEQMDKDDGIFKPDFYEVEDIDHCRVER